MKNQKGAAKIGLVILLIILIILLIVSFKIYKIHYFSGFDKATADATRTKFLRDDDIKYSESSSYKIENYEYNDATFYREIEVEPHTPYKISCMVKAENIECKGDNSNAGIVIGLLDTVEYSLPITGTHDWQKIEYIFNSKDRTTVKISFRLGGNESDCKGTAWFSDLKLERGIENLDSEWKVACFLMNKVNVNIQGKQYNLQLNSQDKENAKLNMERYKNDCFTFSNGKMNVEYDIYEINEPVTTLTYTEENGYYASEYDVKDLIYEIAKEKEYDHIFAVCRMEDETGNISIPIENNWIGLGGMDISGIGYSLIRINCNSNKYLYRYGATNQAPEEVYLHEFLHTLERNCKEAGFTIPELHDYEKYEYNVNNTEGLDKWYKDYMQGRIYDKENDKYIGLNEFAYTSQPFNSDNFIYSLEQEFYTEPQNLFEEIQIMYKMLMKKINNK